MKGREIDKIVSKMMKISLIDIRSKRGNRRVSEARFIAMHLRNKYLKKHWLNRVFLN